MSNKWTYLFILITCFINTVSILLVRYGGSRVDFSQGLKEGISSGHLWIAGIFIGWISGLGFSIILTRVKITIAYTLYVPLVYFLVNVGAFYFLGEYVSTVKMVGMGIVLIGLVTLLCG